jgi:hypothetical protein
MRTVIRIIPLKQWRRYLKMYKSIWMELKWFNRKQYSVLDDTREHWFKKLKNKSYKNIQWTVDIRRCSIDFKRSWLTIQFIHDFVRSSRVLWILPFISLEIKSPSVFDRRKVNCSKNQTSIVFNYKWSWRI